MLTIPEANRILDRIVGALLDELDDDDARAEFMHDMAETALRMGATATTDNLYEWDEERRRWESQNGQD